MWPDHLIVIGTRPEAIKLAPVIRAFERQGARHRVRVIFSGQQHDLIQHTCVQVTPDIVLPAVPHGLDLQASRSVLHEQLLASFSDLQRDTPLRIIVQGDTSTALCAALAADDLRLPVFHVEAGLRTGDLSSPYPEEHHRCEIARVATIHYAPTIAARTNLLHEGVDPDTVLVTGNTGIDELLSHQGSGSHSAIRDTVLITLHRAEVRGKHLRSPARTLIHIAAAYPHLRFIWPVHPNPMIRREATQMQHQMPSNMRLIHALQHGALLKMYGECVMVITDSGGVQEESATLGIPHLVLRETTERPETLGSHGRLIAPDDAQGIEQGFEALLGLERLPNSAFGDGRAADRIVEHLLQWAPRR